LHGTGAHDEKAVAREGRIADLDVDRLSGKKTFVRHLEQSARRFIVIVHFRRSPCDPDPAEGLSAKDSGGDDQSEQASENARDHRSGEAASGGEVGVEGYVD
jgi:hypothetical protein